jgi:hypothetical protein
VAEVIENAEQYGMTAEQTATNVMLLFRPS